MACRLCSDLWPRTGGRQRLMRCWVGAPPSMQAIPWLPPYGYCQPPPAQGDLLTIDQRGFPRPQGAHCDIGAYETGHASDSVPADLASCQASATGR
jgi:hypothetical protein